jgi:hypothetical protein
MIVEEGLVRSEPSAKQVADRCRTEGLGGENGGRASCNERQIEELDFGVPVAQVHRFCC